MAKINTKRALHVKPCEVFDLIGGTSTGGIVAIMLGRLEMDINECIKIYKDMFKDVFGSRKHLWGVSAKGKIQARFDEKLLRAAITKVLADKGIKAETMFEDGLNRTTRTFVVATRKENKNLVRIRDYRVPGEINRDPASIIEAALATSAATTFFPPVKIGAREYVDGALGENNPVNVVWREAQNIWCSDSKDPAALSTKLKCFISVGTGNPGTSPMKDSALEFAKDTLKEIVTETERTATAAAELFRVWLNPKNGQRYFRFNVEQGLQNVGLEEYLKEGEIESATIDYLEHQVQKISVEECAGNLSAKTTKTQPQFEPIMVNATEAEDKRRQILEWLDFKDQSVDHDNHRLKRTPGTGKAFLVGSFRKWLTSGDRLLWLSGDVGSGKTKLCSLMIDKMQNMLSDLTKIREPNDAVVYFYINFEDTATHSVRMLLQTIISQLYSKYIMLPEIIDIYDRLRPWKASQTDLIHVLTLIIHNRVSLGADPAFDRQAEFTSITLFLDGLDEIAEMASQVEVLELLRDIAAQDLANVRIVVVSRPDLSIENYLGDWTRVSMEDQAIEADIALFANHEIRRNASLSGQPEEMKTHIVDRLSRGSNGMFRLASLQMEELFRSFLGRSVSRKRVDQILDTLPLSLDGFYDRILNRLPPTLKEELYGVLKWLLCAQIPMRIQDLIDACVIRPQEKLVFDVDDRLDEGDIFGHLQGLIKMRKIFADTVVHKMVSLAHFSVQEYLAPQGRTPRSQHAWRVETKMANFHIAQCCLAYIRHCTIMADPDPRAYPLRSYAWMNWSRHLVSQHIGSTTGLTTMRDSMRLHNKASFPLVYGGHDMSHLEDKDNVLFATATEHLTEDEHAGLIHLLQTQTVQEFAHITTGEVIIIQNLPYPSSHKGYGHHDEPWIPLPRVPETIRLVVLLPALDDDDSIRCRLVVDTLENGPQYIALSYSFRWLDERPHYVWVDGRPVEIRSNLFAALLQLRSEQPLVLWVDILCISAYTDLENRNSLVTYKRSSYSQAKKVVVWLGPASELTEWGLELVQTASGGEARSSTSIEEVLALEDILSRPIWERCYLVQDVALAAEISVKCGQFSIWWDNIRPVKDLLADLPMSTLHSSWTRISALQLIRARYQSTGSIPLYDLLYLSRRHRTTRMIHRIYSMSELLSPAERSAVMLKPDFHVPCHEVYTRATLHILKTRGDLNVLSQAANGSEVPYSYNLSDRSCAWPTWAPTWDQSNTRERSLQLVITPDGVDCSTLYKASGNSKATVPTTEDLCVLAVDGTIVDRIECSYPVRNALQGASRDAQNHTVRMSDNSVATLSQEALLRHPNTGPIPKLVHRYGSVAGVSEAFLRTSLTDRDITADGTWVRLPPTARPVDLHERTPTPWPSDFDFFTTESGYMGAATCDPHVGDVVVLLLGGRVPYILRQADTSPESWQFVGDCYVHGIMDGELMAERSPDTLQAFRII